MTYFIEDYDYKTTSYKPILNQSFQQTIKGQRILHSFLYCFGKTQVEKLESLLAIIRIITHNCAPLLQALYELSGNVSMSLLNSIALEEGFIILIKNVLAEVFKINIPNNKLLEQTLEILGLLCEIGAKHESELIGNEKYQEYSIVCPVSFVQIVRPVCVMKTDGSFCYLELEAANKKAKDQQEIPDIGMLKESDLKEETDFKFLIKRTALNKKETLKL